METTVNKFLCHCKYEKNLSQKTLKAYAIDLDQFKNYVRIPAIYSGIFNTPM